MSRTIDDVVFKDFDFSMEAHPVTGALLTLKNERAVGQAIKNIVLTSRFERFKAPFFGGGVYGSLFENFDPIALTILKRDILDSIRNEEPRAGKLDVRVKDDLDRNGMYITITYTTLNRLEPVTVDFFLQRVR